jgi:hypothetical protein
MSDVIKRCACGRAAWNKCGDPWYLSPFRFGKRLYRDNVTRWALVNLGEAVTTRARAVAVVAIMRARIRARTFESVKASSEGLSIGQRFERVIEHVPPPTRAAILQLLTDCEARIS